MSAGGGCARAVRVVRTALAGRRLVWFGIRGEDAEALTALPELAGACAITAPLRDADGLAYPVDVRLDLLRGARPDLDRYDLDLDASEAARSFRRTMLRQLAEPCVVATYRPSAVVSALALAAAPTATLAGPVHARHAAFDHKPWVERALAARGVRHLGWRYLDAEQRDELPRIVADRPHVLRASATSGGEGLALLRPGEPVPDAWPARGDGLVAVAPFLEGVPVNFSGCVFRDGTVRLHPPSVQLIGIDDCTDRVFGFCGNDFGALPAACDDAVLDRMDALGHAVGAWLGEEGYVGAFGVDTIVADGDVVFTELNARFQGSSALSARIARELDVPDLFLDHLAASLGRGPSGPGLSLRAWARRQPAVARIVVHAAGAAVQARDPAAAPATLLGGARIGQLPGHLPVEAGGVLCCATVSRSVTTSGFALDRASSQLVTALRDCFAVAEGGSSSALSADSSSAMRIASPSSAGEK